MWGVSWSLRRVLLEKLYNFFATFFERLRI